MLRSVVRFARDVAKLPSFPVEHERIDETRLDADSEDEDEFPSMGSVIQLVATDKVPGRSLPRERDVWLALLPFQDLAKKVPEHVQFDLVQKRRTFLDVLVRLAQSETFRWDSSKLHCGEAVGPKTATTFWFDLLRALSPRAMQDVTLELERNLIALSRARRPRFLLCFTNDVSLVDFAGLLGEFLFTSSDDIAELEGTYLKDALDVLDVDDWEDVDVEIGLSFTKGRVSHAAIASLVDVLDKLHARRGDGIRFRVTTLRFGVECTFQAKALELMGRHQLRPTCTIKNIRLANLPDVKTLAKADFFAQLVRGFAYLESLSVPTLESFEALASAVRYGGGSLLQEVDVRYSAANLHAAWLAFAFFHIDSRSTVSSLRLRLPHCKREGVPMVLTSEWIAAFMRTLQSSQAEIDLAGIEGGGALPAMTKSGKQTRTFVCLHPDSIAKAAPVAGAKLLWEERRRVRGSREVQSLCSYRRSECRCLLDTPSRNC